ncbi:MAG: hypothetical protein M2R45_04411 [Verrucomicrobia subdivision 3 bacterium]|nr:hypothetical protein [Limisphaerales bacterium]MCS1417251.1 hypothetical protein [Limisphaerales bacterium]
MTFFALGGNPKLGGCFYAARTGESWANDGEAGASVAHRVCCLGDDAIYGRAKALGLRGFQLSGSSLGQSSG